MFIQTFFCKKRENIGVTAVDLMVTLDFVLNDL